MSVENLTIYDSWDMRHPSIPQRSRLFSLKPILIGTPYVESLTSYLIRLASLHCLSLSIFISRLISPYLHTTFLKNWSSRSLGALFQKARALQSHGDLAQDFVQALESLTLRKDLSFLTLSVWSNVLSHKALLRNNKAWCPLCYQQQLLSHHHLYEPLLWSLLSVKVCPQHHLKLWENCPHCGNSQPWLTWKSSIGCCSNCHQLLFSPTETLSTNLAQDLLQVNIAVSQSLGSLIEIMPILNHNPTQDHLWHNISEIINGVTQGNISEFAQHLNLPKNTVWGWYHRKSLPPLASCLKISDCFRIPLLTLLTEKINKNELDTFSARQLPKQQPSARKSPSQLNLNLLQQQLLEVLNLPDVLSPSLKEVSETLGYHHRTLSRHFPELCQAISAKYRQKLKNIQHETINKSCEEVRTITYSLYAECKYPSEARVATRLSHPSFFRYPQVREVFKQVKQDLGIEP